MRARLVASALAGAVAAAFPALSSADTVWEWSFGGSGGTCVSCSGTSAGNSRIYSGIGTGAPNVTANAWANTTSNNSTDNPPNPVVGTLGAAYLGWSSGSGLTVGNVDGGSSASGGGDANEPSTSPEHAMDSQQRYDAMLFNFGDGNKVKLTDVNVGWVHTNGDIDLSIFAYIGAGAPSLSGAGYPSLTGPNWVKTNYDESGTGWKDVNPAGTEAQYWLLAAYVPASLPGTVNGLDPGDDYGKIKGLKVTKTNNKVPEPSTLLLFGVAALAVTLRRRVA